MTAEEKSNVRLRFLKEVCARFELLDSLQLGATANEYHLLDKAYEELFLALHLLVKRVLKGLVQSYLVLLNALMWILQKSW